MVRAEQSRANWQKAERCRRILERSRQKCFLRDTRPGEEGSSCGEEFKSIYRVLIVPVVCSVGS